MFKNEVLPDPDGPMIATNSPRSTRSVKSVSASSASSPLRYTFLIPRISIMALGASKPRKCTRASSWGHRTSMPVAWSSWTRAIRRPTRLEIKSSLARASSVSASVSSTPVALPFWNSTVRTR